MVRVRTLFPVSLRDASRLLVVAEAGGRWTRAARVDGTGGVLDRRKTVTPKDPGEGIAVVERLWKELGPADGRALAVAGGIRSATGEITQSPYLPDWEGARPGEALGCPVVGEGNATLLGEAWRGALQGRRTALLVRLGRSISGGLLVGGRLWVGADGCAGQVGHVTVRPGGDACSCGSFGCLEAYAGETVLCRESGCPDVASAATAARAGDTRALAAFEQAAAALGIALAAVANLLNPEVVCLGGNVADAFDLLAPRALREVKSRAFRLAAEGLEIVPAVLGEDAGLLGAAWVALGHDAGRRVDRP